LSKVAADLATQDRPEATHRNPEIPFPSVGDQITAIVGQDGRKYVAVKRIRENLGVDSDSQLRNLSTTHAHWACTVIMTVK